MSVEILPARARAEARAPGIPREFFHVQLKLLGTIGHDPRDGEMRSAITVIVTLALCLAATAATADWPPRRYMEGTNREFCKRLTSADELGGAPVVKEYIKAAKANVDVVACVYPFKANTPLKGQKQVGPDRMQKGWVVLADPSVVTVTKWITAACKVGAPNNVSTCVTAMQDYINGQSGAQVPVIGYVAEGPDGELCKQNNKPVPFMGLIAFQDGVTIQRNSAPGDNVP